MKVWIDGRIVSADAPAIAPADPAVQYGFGLFEVTRAYGGTPFRLGDHLERMARSARRFGLRLRTGARTVERAVRTLCRANRAPEAYVRVTLTAGGRLIVAARPLELLPRAWYREGARVGVAAWRRDTRAPLVGHKTCNYLENVLTRERALGEGLADALQLDLDGNVLEASVSNVFLVRRGVLVTPPLAARIHGERGAHAPSRTILPGVTRKVVLEIARRLALRAVERAVPLRAVAAADEAFLTNAIIEVLPVTRVDGRRVGDGRPGPVTRLVAMAYKSTVLTECRRPD